MVKLAANLTMMFNEHAFLDRFAAAADAGFTAVEFLFPYDHTVDAIAERLQHHKLTLALFNLPPGDWAAGARGMAAVPAQRAAFAASVAQAMDYAKVLKPARLHLMSGHGRRDDADAVAAYSDNIALACAAAAPLGIEIVIEPINGRDMPGYFLNDFAWAANLIGAIGLPNLKLQYDIYHRQILHGDVLTSLAKLLPIIGHVQIAAVPHRHEPGSGELDDIGILQQLDALGYRDFVGLEYRPKGDTVMGLVWRDHLTVMENKL
ncbi:hydroxypyruvate isomerase family protein [Devosia beringensis]|uniref:hydroxypyruvate isomerase family protein n=1 Tax=Devosia beringensis TaxID=2657486 RepID=UPI00186BB14D|nr:TIM barrel protein [Devosia beringensis]